jgi:enamine deaminase RidA (YjgF/YER057c/UK114 family)
VPWHRHAELPPDFAGQCRLAWRNVLSVLAEAGMGLTNLALRHEGGRPSRHAIEGDG